MSGEEDTFEIDIYGDGLEAANTPQEGSAQVDNTTQGQDDQRNFEDEIDYSDDAVPEVESSTAKSATEAPQQGTKRKAVEDADDQGYDQNQDYEQQDDARPLDPGAQPALRLAELHWWTTEEDVRAICARAEAEREVREIAFGEHKINGKSKGEVYLEFASPQAATAVKRAIDAANQVAEEGGIKKSPFTAHYTQIGNPYRTSAGGGAKKEHTPSGGRGGAYNSFPPRGGYRGRGGGYHDRGGFNNNMNNRGGHQGGWGMNGMNGGFQGGYGQNPMMAGGYNNMGMGGFGGMNRGGMMNNMGMMGGRGGFGGMGAGMMGGMGPMNMGGMMGGRGGGMMGGRGGWNGGGNFQGGGGYGGGQGGGNKRMRTE